MKKYIWNPHIRENILKESLFYVRLSFSPRYLAKKTALLLENYFEEEGVNSYAIWEITGNFDLLLRFWLPSDKHISKFHQGIVDCLDSVSLSGCDYFGVANYVHWLWENGNDKSVINSVKSITNEIVDKFNSSKVDKKTEKFYVENNVLRKWRRTNGITFVITIPPPVATINEEGKKAFWGKLVGVMESSRCVNDFACYSGVGFCNYILVGTVKYSEFGSIDTEVLDKISELSIMGASGIRTQTNILLGNGGAPIKYKDKMELVSPIIDKEEIPEENQYLECKASFSLDTERYLKGDGKETYDKMLSFNGVGKNVVGMLNAKGGVLIIGLSEKETLGSRKLEELSKKYPSNNLYLICGIEIEYNKKGWDEYSRRLQRFFRDYIEPNPLGHLRLERQMVKGKALCFIHIVRKVKDSWFYLKHNDQKKFYVRHGAETVMLSGISSDEYKNSL